MQFTSNDLDFGRPDWAQFLFKEKTYYLFFAVLTIILTTSSFYYYFAKGNIGADGLKGSATDNKLYLLLWFTLYGFAGFSFLLTFLKKGIYTSFFLVVPFLLWIIFSFSWSVSSGRTLYFAVMVIMQIFMAYVVVENIRPETFLKIMVYSFAALLVLSLLGFLVMPEKTSHMRYGGGWLIDSEMNGVFSHKSDAGYFFALLIVMLMSAKDIGIRYFTALRYTLIPLAIIGIIFANSATALAAVLFFFGVYSVLPYVKDRRWLLYLLGFALLVFAIIVPYINIGQFAVLIGRDPGLTGRGQIWQHGIEFIANKPFIGYGYYGFFDENIFSPVWKLWAQFEYFLTPHFHNSGLDIVVSLGLVGLGGYIYVMVKAFSVLYNDSLSFVVRLTVYLVLLLFIITSAFDFTLMKHNHFATFFLFYTFFLAHKRDSQFISS